MIHYYKPIPWLLASLVTRPRPDRRQPRWRPSDADPRETQWDCNLENILHISQIQIHFPTLPINLPYRLIHIV